MIAYINVTVTNSPDPIVTDPCDLQLKFGDN